MGLVTIRGQTTGYYVCMNSTGHLYAEVSRIWVVTRSLRAVQQALGCS